MKFKLKVFFAVAIASLQASPVGNPAFPRLIQEGYFIPGSKGVNVRAGYEGNFVGDARLEQEKEGSGRVDSFRQSANAGTVTLNVSNRFDFYTVLGASQFNADWRFEILEDSALAVHRAQLETLTQFLWGIGTRAILFETPTLTVGAGGRYSFCQTEPVVLAIDAIEQAVAGTKCRWNEWQIDLDFAFQIDLFTPYVGVTYSFTHVWIGPFSTPISMNDSGVNHFETRQPVGAVIGCSISTGKYFMLNVEAHLISEEAVTISGDLRF